MDITCIMCPVGCRITLLQGENGFVVTGNHCKRGELYAVQEVTAPKRVVTAIFTLTNGEVVSVKTSAPVHKDMIFGILKEIQKATKEPPVHIGDVLIPNVSDSGADIVATSDKE